MITFLLWTSTLFSNAFACQANHTMDEREFAGGAMHVHDIGNVRTSPTLRPMPLYLDQPCTGPTAMLATVAAFGASRPYLDTPARGDRIQRVKTRIRCRVIGKARTKVPGRVITDFKGGYNRSLTMQRYGGMMIFSELSHRMKKIEPSGEQFFKYSSLHSVQRAGNSPKCKYPHLYNMYSYARLPTPPSIPLRGKQSRAGLSVNKTFK